MRQLFGKLSGTQITIVLLALALSGPGTLGAAVVYQAVGLVDPGTGAKAQVDSARNLHVADTFVDYAHNPANVVNISAALVFQPGVALQPTLIYQPPAGKTLLIKSAQFNYGDNTSGNTIVFEALTTNASNGNQYKFEFIANNAAGSLSTVFESPLVVKAGAALTGVFVSGPTKRRTASLHIQGYLVPAASVPATASVAEAEQFVQVGKPEFGTAK
ncbi:hypothetical protein [Methylosinus sp. Sm6]|uniref:hypothetical protein n=1 Tax=Methylosinus sp. Sm6 TaxID=2866948 RepID=UPI001C99CE22|nr:hypothetical protein [Methylosinus sp. Sm6]MBY6242939.1 hypothetical protein [Methylosinus sp. Sm6]